MSNSSRHGASSTSRRHRSKLIRRLRRHKVATVLVPLGVLVLAVTGWVGWELRQEVAALSELRASASNLTAGTKDAEALELSLSELRADAAKAREIAQHPVLLTAEKVPWIGDNVAALGTVSRTAALLADTTDGLDDILPKVLSGGKPDLASSAELVPFLQEFGQASEQGVADLDRANTPALIPMVRSQLSAIKQMLAPVSPALKNLGPYLQAMAVIAGSDNGQTWFVVMQNLDEARPAGGLISNWMVLHSERGKLALLNKGPNGDLLKTGPVSYKSIAPKPYQAIWGAALSDWRSMNIPANFPDSAQMMAKAWNDRHKLKVDGVITLGQGSVKYLAAAAGPINIGAKQIRPEELTDYMTLGVYRDYKDPKKVDQVVSQLSAEVFRRLASGQVDVKTLLKVALEEQSADYLQLWSAKPGVQAQIEKAGLSGEFGAEQGPVTSVRLVNGGGNKMDAFMHLNVDYGLGECVRDDSGIGSRASTLTVRLENAAPTSGLPEYVSVRGDLKAKGVPRSQIVEGSNLDYVVVYAPRSAVVTGTTQDGAPTAVQQVMIGDREMLVFSADLNPGQSTLLTLTWDEQTVDAAGQPLSTAPRVVLPPLINPATVTTTSAKACG